ncbi:hypothetical protein [Mycobacterium florentinum]|uniref:hypothetical protein n=1 Tax=Mycobacterium florentinum TaxID=292462 RepID=UPI00138C25A2|nr:hypothetical protein [Mycobacterium florentinum]BBX81589.1 hypothetical protein MFLOJ_53760 [Mycobacterium florentinum]
MLLPLGSPLPDDSVAAVRGESGMLGRLTVPLSWGVAVPPDDYDHWAPEREELSDADGKATDGPDSEAGADGISEKKEWGHWNEWGGDAEPRFEPPRTGSVVPHSPWAG